MWIFLVVTLSSRPLSLTHSHFQPRMFEAIEGDYIPLVIIKISVDDSIYTHLATAQDVWYSSG